MAELDVIRSVGLGPLVQEFKDNKSRPSAKWTALFLEILIK